MACSADGVGDGPAEGVPGWCGSGVRDGLAQKVRGDLAEGSGVIQLRLWCDPAEALV